MEDEENKEEQLQFIINQHCGKTSHRGINDVYLALRKKVYWPGMLTDITKYINNSLICNKKKYDRNPPKPPFQITKPFEKLQMDVLFYSSTRILTIVDEFSKKLTAYIIKTTNH